VKLFPEYLIDKLDFSALKAHISHYGRGVASRNYALHLPLLEDQESAQHQMHCIEELRVLLASGGDVFFEETPDLNPILKEAAIEGFILGEYDIFLIAKSARNLVKFKKFLDKQEDGFIHLNTFLENFHFDLIWLKEIDRCISKDGKIKPEASNELKKAQQRHLVKEDETRSRLNQLFKIAKENNYTSEPSITIRNGRMVMPLLVEHKRKFPGVIHDESATGKTIYLEPNEVFELNNELKNIEYEMEREKRIILAKLSQEIRSKIQLFKQSFHLFTLLDFFRSVSSAMGDLETIIPEFSSDGFNLNEATNPVLFIQNQKRHRPTIPLSLKTSLEKSLILVSGPNAGGKSVALKTVGLIQLMAQSGLPIPAKVGTTLKWFEKFFVDLVDNQSVSNELSTYSAHLATMRKFMAEGDEKTLILIDEFGMGTDPTFGGAIAEAILEELIQQKCWGMINTHFSNLKTFAAEHPGIENASMSFNIKTLEPRFQFEQGIPGSSYALEIAQKMGIPEKVIGNAEKKAGRKQKDVDSFMIDFQRREQELKRLVEGNTVKDDLLEDLIQKNKNAEIIQKQTEKEIIRKAKEEAAKILQDAQKVVEKTVQDILSTGAEKEKIKVIRQSFEVQKNKIKDDLQKLPPPPTPKASTDALTVGGWVKYQPTGGKGRIIELKNKRAFVEFDDIRMMVDPQLLIPIKNHKSATQQKVTISITNPMENLSSNLDLRGFRGPEAIAALEAWLDRCVLTGAGNLSILHGRGDGILRKLIREQLRRHPNVESYESEHADRGGDGITLVRLK